MLKIYKNITPNVNKHFYFTNFENYLTMLGEPFDAFDLRDSRVNGNVIMVKMLEVDAKDITYIVDDILQKCWHVDFYNYQSGMAIFNCSVDYWGTYIHKATIKDIHVDKCNRNIGKGWYDDINSTYGNRTIENLGNGGAVNCVVFTVAYTVRSSTLISQSASKVATYVAYNVGGTTRTFADMVNIIGGIYAIKGSGWLLPADLDCQVIDAYLAYSNMWNSNKESTTNLPTFKSSSTLGELEFLPNAEILPHTKFLSFVTTFNPNYNYYAGTINAGMKLARCTQPDTITFMFNYKQNGMQVIVAQGDTQEDITNAFSVGLTVNEGVVTNTERIARALNLIGGTAKAVKNFDIIGGTSNVVNQLTFKSRANLVNGGDGLTNFGSNMSNIVPNLQKYLSNDNEEEHARLYGANFNEFIATLMLDSYALLGSGDFDFTYIKCSAFIEGIPTNALNYISSLLSSGVYYKCI